MEQTVVQGARRIDPDNNIDDVVDLLIDGDRVARLGPPGSSRTWSDSENARRISDSQFGDDELIVCPALVDLHTHVCGAAGVLDIDAIGVRSAVPVVVDAGGSGAATIDDFIGYRLPSAKTRVLAFMAIEAAGIVESDPTHNTKRNAQQMHTSSVSDFLAAIERHQPYLVGVKVWATAAAGLGWIDHATNLSEMAELPLMVHIGEMDGRRHVVDLSGDLLDRLQGGDIVTHCFTARPGGIIDEEGNIRTAARAARNRGVLFDSAAGLVNLCFDRARAALEQGWLPDVISTDVHCWTLDHSISRSLPRTMSAFLTLGMNLADVIARASTRPAAFAGTQIGRPLLDEPATLSLLRRTKRRTTFDDGTTRLFGAESLEPVGCFLDGTYHDAFEAPHLATPCLGALTPEARHYIERLVDELRYHRSHDARWRGDELHRLVHRARVDCGLSIVDGLDALHVGLHSDAVGPAAGWLLESIGPESTLQRLEAALSG